MAGVERFRVELQARLAQGGHLVLWGPRGTGKTTLLRALREELASHQIPTGYAASAHSLDAITRAFAEAYPGTDIEGLPRKRVRARLRLAAEARRGVLLLDHATTLNTQVVGLLRRLRGGVMGVLLAADVDSERVRQRVRDWHLGAVSLRMPAMSAARLRRAFLEDCREAGVDELIEPWESQLIRAAAGRIGWMRQCAGLIARPQYWDGKILHASVLCSDTEMMLRDPEITAALLGEHPRGISSP